MKLAVVGAGWAGLAAAMQAVGLGHAVTVFEAAREPGGRARALPVDTGAGPLVLDNGQHILIGAYRDTLRLLRQAGVDPAQALLRLPLALRFPDGGGLDLPSLPPPLDAAWGVLRARGWTWRDKAGLARLAAGWRRAGFRCDDALTVAQLCAGAPRRVMDELVEPLCVAALNVPAGRASAAVFLRVLQDALFAPAEAGIAPSNLLLPRVDLGSLFPQAAVRWLRGHGAAVRLGERVTAVERAGGGWRVQDDAFDAVLLACPPWEAARLAAGAGAPPAWSEAAGALAHEAIATVYATGGPTLPRPMLALRGGPAQFVFDRGQLGGPAGLLAFVASASHGDARTVEDAVVAQAAAIGWPVRPLQTVVEKRATFACVPGVRRPPPAVAPGLWACGDYIDGPYPSTLEGAVRSALAAVGAIGAGR